MGMIYDGYASVSLFKNAGCELSALTWEGTRRWCFYILPYCTVESATVKYKEIMKGELKVVAKTGRGRLAYKLHLTVKRHAPGDTFLRNFELHA